MEKKDKHNSNAVENKHCNKKTLTVHNPRVSINLEGLYCFICPGSHVAFVKHFPADIYSPVLVDTCAAIPSLNISEEEASSQPHHGHVVNWVRK